VSAGEFDRLFKTLKETGGWYCAETSTGGRTGWKAEDPRGLKYQYTAISDGKEQSQELRRLEYGGSAAEHRLPFHDDPAAFCRRDARLRGEGDHHPPLLGEDHH
jgi:hypothetical protein